MKKMLLASLSLILAMPLTVIAQEAAPFVVPANETSLSAGFEFGNNIVQSGTAAKDKEYFGSPGGTIEGYSFWNGGNLGVFFHVAGMFPAIGDKTDDFQTAWLFGPAFRVRLADKLTLQTGIGIGGNNLSTWYEESGTDYYRSTMFLAVGVDTGLKFDLTDKFFIKGGVNAAWSFIGWTNTRKMWDWRGWTDADRQSGYSINVNPCIGFGVNIYSPRREIPRSEGPHLGKPASIKH